MLVSFKTHSGETAEAERQRLMNSTSRDCGKFQNRSAAALGQSEYPSAMLISSSCRSLKLRKRLGLLPNRLVFVKLRNCTEVSMGEKKEAQIAFRHCSPIDMLARFRCCRHSKLRNDSPILEQLLWMMLLNSKLASVRFGRAWKMFPGISTR